MQEELKLYIYEKGTFTPGQDTFFSSVLDNNAVVFEDDEQTGYFYAVDPTNDSKVLDALHVYDAAKLSSNKPCTLKILWTEDAQCCLLSINNVYHAVFDFKNRAGYCRNGFPENRSGWALVAERQLTDELLKKLVEPRS